MQAELELRIADKMVIDDRLEAMLDADEDEVTKAEAYLPPTPYQNFAWAAKRAQQKLNMAESEGAPEFNLDLLRDYILECDAWMKRDAAANAPPPMQAAPMMDPMAPAPVDPMAGGMPMPMGAAA